MFRRKKHSWFRRSAGWLAAGVVLYWFSKFFLKAAAKLNDTFPAKKKNEDDAV